MQINTEDITVPWGRAPDPLDVQMGRWRMAVYQDVQESLDRSKLYFLYNPVADENSGTSGGRKGSQGLVVFDLNLRCFVREIPLNVQGSVKFFFCLKCPSSSGGSSFVLVTDNESYGQMALLLWRVDINHNGLNLEGEPRALLTSTIPVSGEYIVSMREDVPELVVMTAPGLTVWRINCLVDHPSNPTDSYSIPNADLSHYYDAFVSKGSIYFVSASPDGHLDYSRVHSLQIDGRNQICTQMCSPDPLRGTPSARKQAALASIAGFILLAGGEIDYGDSVTRLVDYWVLDLAAFQWIQIPAQMPVPLIEPRLTTTNSGSVYLWGDFDQPLPGMPCGTHLRILKVSGFESMNPPPYSQALSQPVTAPYPSTTAYSAPYPAGSSQQPYSAPYPNPQGYGQQAPPSYGMAYGQQPAVSGQLQSQPQQMSYPQSPQQQGSGQYAYYPPSERKDCCIQ